MALFGNLFLFGILSLNIFGLALVTGLWLRNGWLALTAGPWLLCSLLFFIENFFGLGDLRWVWPITSALSIALILEATGHSHFLARFDPVLKLEEWKRELSPRLVPGPYAVFAGLFAYVMLWRYRYPNIDANSEKLADLSFVSSYFSGEKIPVRDVWLSGYLSTHYYSFQYYAAALLGRILGVECGTAYNLAICALIALAGTAGVGGICLVTRKLWIRILVSAGWLVGGSGVTGIVHWIIKDATLWNDFRFINDPALNYAPLGPLLTAYEKHFAPVSTPAEPLSYSIYLGDYHPPLAGFYLLTLALLALTLWARGASPWVLAIVGASLPWCVVADTWNVPLEAIGLTAWGLYNIKGLWAGAWKYLLAGAVGAMTAIYPYYRLFAFSAQDSSTAFAFVPLSQHTPPLLWLLFLLPTVGLTLLSLCSGNRLLAVLGMLWLGFLFFSEFFYINDIYSGPFIRFNTTLKWRPWISAGALLTVGPRLLELSFEREIRITRLQWWLGTSALLLAMVPMLLALSFERGITTWQWWLGISVGVSVVLLAVVSAVLVAVVPMFLEMCSKRRRVPSGRWLLAIFLIAYPILYFWDLASFYAQVAGINVGQLDGTGYLTAGVDNPNLNDRLLLNYLRTSPRRVVVEHPDMDFTNYSGMTTLSGQQAYIGWLGHEQLWRGYLYELQYRYDHLVALYKGTLPDADEWAQAQGIDYILWFKPADTDALWDKVNDSLQPLYSWHEFYHDRGHRVGLWERNKPG